MTTIAGFRPLIFASPIMLCMRMRAGSKKAIVLPDPNIYDKEEGGRGIGRGERKGRVRVIPVSAIPTMSWPRRAMGHV